jgi:uncharacterized protein
VAAPFACQRCGNCCRRPGRVCLTPEDTAALAAWLGVSVPAFTAAWTTLRGDRLGLQLTNRPDGACVFLEESLPRCRVHAAKPAQCRAFPERWRYPDFESVCAAARDGWRPSSSADTA